MNTAAFFRNRTHAGKHLARALAQLPEVDKAIVLALPRGGVPVGFALARELSLPLDVVLVRKLGMPGHEECAIGAVAQGDIRVIERAAVDSLGMSDAALEALCTRELAVIERRARLYRGARPPPELQERHVLLVDDGLATGASMRAAVEATRLCHPARVTVAVPVGARASCQALAGHVDQLVCLHQPASFRAVSEAYRQFDQTTDDEVQDLLALAWRSQRWPSPPSTVTTARRTP
jgi:putative phosphoribosyl transferase